MARFRDFLYVQDTETGTVYKVKAIENGRYKVDKPLGEGATFTSHGFPEESNSLAQFWLQSGDRVMGKNDKGQELLLEIKEISNFEHTKSVGVKVHIVSVDGKYINKYKWIDTKLIEGAEII